MHVQSTKPAPSSQTHLPTPVQNSTHLNAFSQWPTPGLEEAAARSVSVKRGWLSEQLAGAEQALQTWTAHRQTLCFPSQALGRPDSWSSTLPVAERTAGFVRWASRWPTCGLAEWVESGRPGGLALSENHGTHRVFPKMVFEKNCTGKRILLKK